ncbi:hypothetical protein HanPSC8_Chr11g0486431 [Helianthus annuus]|nr:hypothetical protein HanPSC8_Chr11g0486431 [Helianthus annuus]
MLWIYLSSILNMEHTQHGAEDQYSRTALDKTPNAGTHDLQMKVVAMMEQP